MTSPYKVRHWSPVKRVPIAYDVWYNPIAWEDVSDDTEDVEQDSPEEKSLGLIFFSKILYFFLLCECREEKHYTKHSPPSSPKETTPHNQSICYVTATSKSNEYGKERSQENASVVHVLLSQSQA